MNPFRHRSVTLRTRASDLQTTLRRWAMYDDSLPRDMKEELLSRFTPAEETTFESDLELTKARLRYVSVQIRTVAKWYDFILETIHTRIDEAARFEQQGRIGEAAAILDFVEAQLLVPNEITLGFVFRAFAQHASHEYHQKLASIDAIIRDLYLPTMKLAHQRGLVAKEGLSQTPFAYLTDGSDGAYTWRHHAHQSTTFGRQLPVTMLAVPRTLLAQPWNMVTLAHEVGVCLYQQLQLGWEIAGKLQSESIHAGVAPQTAPLWARWHETIFADVFGTLKLGPAYAFGMIEYLGSHSDSVFNMSDGTMPPAYVRWHVIAQTLQLMQFPDQARAVFQRVHTAYGDPGRASAVGGSLIWQLVRDARGVAGLIAFGPCRRLGGARIVDMAQPFMAVEWQSAVKVSELLLAGDETCSSDEQFRWAEPVTKTPTPAHVALSGLRSAFETTSDYGAARKLWVRFWCLMQCLTGNTEPIREREDQEFALGDAVLRTMAQQAVAPRPSPQRTGSTVAVCA